MVNDPITKIMRDASEIVRYDEVGIPLSIREGLLSAYPNHRALCHWHEDIEWVYIRSGQMNYYMNGKRVLLNTGEALMVNSRQMHYGYSENGQDCDFIRILCHPKIFITNSVLYQSYIAPVLSNPSLEYLHLKPEFPEDAEALLAQSETLGEAVGDYLEEQFENVSQIKKQAYPTIGSLYQEMDNRQETLFLPYVTVKDETVDAYVQNILNSFKDSVSKVVAKSDVELPDYNGDKRLVRNTETALGDLAADAFRVMMDADIGIMNGGGLRAPIKKGDITLNDMLSVFPWGNLPCKMEVTGQTVLDMLEMGAMKYPKESGGFLSVSGLKYTILAGVPSSVETNDKGEFVKVAGDYRVCNVQVLDKKPGLYQPLDLKKTYTLGGIDYTITYCGDGFTMFKNSKVLKAGDATMTDAQTVLSYIETKLGGTIGEEYAKPAGRITIYSDVKATDWYLKAVKYALDAGLMNGVGSGFAPNGALTRGMLVTVLYRMAGSPKVEGKVSEKFSDCTDGSWYADAVLWASANKVVDGYEDGTFKPTKSITRQEMAKVLYGYDKIGGKTAEGITEKLTYTDLDAIADWALEAVTYCTAEKYLAGSNGAFSPKGTATRAMGAKVLMNMTKEAA